MWAQMVEQMRAKSLSPPESLLDQLDTLRIHFRNPTQHPEARYDIYEAQELLGDVPWEVVSGLVSGPLLRLWVLPGIHVKGGPG